MSLTILRPGLLSIVQDAGRTGFRADGVSLCGALDEFAYRTANTLVGDPERLAVIETTLAGLRARFDRDAVIAVCGADLDVHADDTPLPLWRPIAVRAGATLSFRRTLRGCRAYLAVRGGIDVPVVLGSRSTDLRACLGGHAGRALRAGDVLPTGVRDDDAHRTRDTERDEEGAAERDGACAARWFVSHAARPAYSDRPVLRVTPGAEFAEFTDEARRLFFAEEFVVTIEANRMAYRLRGADLKLKAPREMLSTAVAPGAIQVPPGGDPLLLLADCQTTGGYPVIAHVIRVDLPLVAQTKPGDPLRFALVTRAEARRALLEQERDLALLRLAVSLRTR